MDASESAKDPSCSATAERSDRSIIISLEYDHNYLGLLNYVLDTCLKEYIHKATGFVVFYYIRRLERFMQKLVWVATVLRHRQQEVGVEKKTAA